MTALMVLTKALKNCATNYNPKDLNDWSERNTLPAMAVDLYCELEKMGYHLEQFKFQLEENTVDPFLVGE